MQGTLFIKGLAFLGLALAGLTVRAQDSGAIFVFNATDAEVRISNTLSEETSLTGEVTVTHYDVEAETLGTPVVQRPELNPKGAFQVIRPGGMVQLLALDPKGHTSLHTLSRKGSEQQVRFFYSVKVKDHAYEGVGQAVKPSLASSSAKPFAVLDDTTPDVLMLFPPA